MVPGRDRPLPPPAPPLLPLEPPVLPPAPRILLPASPGVGVVVGVGVAVGAPPGNTQAIVTAMIPMTAITPHVRRFVRMIFLGWTGFAV